MNRLFLGHYDLASGETTIETITIAQSQKEIMVTDGVRHSIPLDEILSGGPPKDGIPSIDKPKFVSAAEAKQKLSWLTNDDVGLALTFSGISRFYPFDVLVWHEIVNDMIAGQRVLVTYCPLCYTAIVFDPVVQDERVEFGVSGKLWNSNLLMYDRKTDTLWSQVKAEAVVGEMTGTRLKVTPSDVTRFGIWKEQFPQGEVLTDETGTLRSYGGNPYADSYEGIQTFFPYSGTDSRLGPQDIVLGIVIDGRARAYHDRAVERAGSFIDEFAGKKFSVEWNDELHSVRIFEVQPDGSKVNAAPVIGFWFSWVSSYQDTELFK